MFQKLMGFKAKAASQLLSKVNISKQRAHFFTQLTDLTSIEEKLDNQTIKIHHFLRVIKKQSTSIRFLLKSAILAHFFIQRGDNKQHSHLLAFVNFLILKCEELSLEYGCSLSISNTKLCKTSLSTQSDEVVQGRQGYILKEIARPYLAYLTKLLILKQQMPEQFFSNNDVWRLINLMKVISSFTNSFMVIGRYYMKEYGAVIIFLSQILAVDINNNVSTINEYIRRQFYCLSLNSQKVEDKREVEEFRSILEENGSLNEKLNQFFMGKYFYEFLKHLERPKWLDNNSPEFDSLFPLRETATSSV